MGICEDCIEFEYDGGVKGYCRRYKAYYLPNDSCSKFSPRDSSYGIGCYLTTACCEYFGLPDNCEELTVMRNYRDNYLKTRKDGNKIIEYYYKDAPSIVERINGKSNKKEIYSDIYNRIIEIVSLIKNGENEMALTQYILMTYLLQRDL